MGFTNGDHEDVLQQSYYSFESMDAILKPSSLWFDLRLFYMRVSGRFNLKEEQLALVYAPLGPGSILGVDGRRSPPAFLDRVSTSLRRDRIGGDLEDESVFTSTDRVRVSGRVGFEVLEGREVLVSGVLELSSSGTWSLGNCRSHVGWRRRGGNSRDTAPPLADIYVAGNFSGKPTVLSKMIGLLPSQGSSWKLMLDTIPEDEASRDAPLDASEPSKDRLPGYIPEGIIDDDDDVDDDNLRRMYQLSWNVESEDWELSWFNAGMRAGFGISVGICIGVGLGLGLLAKTYQVTSSRFRRSLLF